MLPSQPNLLLFSLSPEKTIRQWGVKGTRKPIKAPQKPLGRDDTRHPDRFHDLPLAIALATTRTTTPANTPDATGDTPEVTGEPSGVPTGPISPRSIRH